MKKIDVNMLLACMFSATIAYFGGRFSVSNHSEITPEDSTVVSDATAGNPDAGTFVPEPIPERSVWVYNLTDNVVYEKRVQDSPHWSEIYMSDGTVITNGHSHFVNTGKEMLPATVTAEMTNEMRLIDGEHVFEYFNWVFKTSNKVYKHRDSLMVNFSFPNQKSVPVSVPVSYKY